MKTKNKIIVLFTLLLGVAMVSCEGSFDFNKEQYKKVVYIMGGNNSFQIYDRTVLNLEQPSDTILYMTVGVGGTKKPDKDITVTIASADSLFNAYNKSNYDIDTAKFAKKLKPEFYTLPDTLKVVIKAGTTTAKVPVPVKNLGKLSPDTTYFLNYKILSVDNYEVSKEHREALYQIFYKNRWSNTKKVPNYIVSAFSMGLKNNPGNDTIRMSASPKLFPLTKNSVRVTVGKSKYEELEDINANSFVIEIDDKPFYEKEGKMKIYKVRVKRYKDMTVTQKDPVDPKNEFNNTFVDEIQENVGVKRYYRIFNLRFEFTSKDSSGKSVTRLMEERLKVEYNPTVE